MKPIKLLIVANMPSENTTQLAQSVLKGARHPESENVETSLYLPQEASATDVLSASGIIIGTTENFGYMSGLIKDFFERIYYPCLDQTQALPWALYIRAGKDGTGTQRAVNAIVGGMRWRAVQPPLLLVGEFKSDFFQWGEELGQTMAMGLSVGLF